MPMRKHMIFILFLLAARLSAQHASQLAPIDDSWFSNEGKPPCVGFSFGIETGAMFGVVAEWLFIDRSGGGGYDDVLSRLDWRLQPIFFGGVSGGFTPLPRLFFGCGVWLGLPGPAGFLEDRDWDPLTGDYITYAHVENDLLDAVVLDFNAGYAVLLRSSITCNCLIGFSFMQFRMRGHDGWQEHPPGTFDQFLPGDQIDYEADIFMPYFGCEAKWSPLDWLSINAFLAVSPWLTFAYARDMHLNPLAPGYYQDLPRFGFSFSGSASIVFRIGGRITVQMKNAIAWTPPFQGPTSANGSPVPSERGGVSLILYSASASLNVSFPID